MKSLIKTATLLLFACTLALPVFSSGIQEDVRTIEVTGMDNLKYDKTLIEVSPGETIRLVFKVESNVPPQAMSHNIAILPQGMDADTFAMASMGARDNEYIAPDYEDQLIAYTEMIGGGETSTVEFTVPETAGDYDYICTFPGHYQGGMVGILRVK